MRFGIVVFPGTWSDGDCYHVTKSVLGQNSRYIWHTDTDLSDIDCVVLPGGFSYGDYLRTGAIARFSPIMTRVAEFAAAGGPVLGICNGFQILLEAGLLPGAMRRNRGLKFICEHVHARVEETDTSFTRSASVGQLLRMPIAHGEGNYYADAETLETLEKNRQVVFRYADPNGRLDDRWNVNGSTAAIAGVCNSQRNVVGLMPHPERACESSIGSMDGRVVLESVVPSIAERLSEA